MRHHTADEVREMLRKRQGERSLREFAAELGIAPSMLSMVYTGDREPSPEILKLIGLTRRVCYVRE